MYGRLKAIKNTIPSVHNFDMKWGGEPIVVTSCSKVKGQWVSEWVSSLSTSATLATAMGTNGGQSWALERHAENVFASLDPAFLNMQQFSASNGCLIRELNRAINWRRSEKVVS